MKTKTISVKTTATTPVKKQHIEPRAHGSTISFDDLRSLDGLEKIEKQWRNE